MDKTVLRDLLEVFERHQIKVEFEKFDICELFVSSNGETILTAETETLDAETIKKAIEKT